MEDITRVDADQRALGVRLALRASGDAVPVAAAAAAAACESESTFSLALMSLSEGRVLREGEEAGDARVAVPNRF